MSEPRENHECVYENGDGICRECADLADLGRNRARQFIADMTRLRGMDFVRIGMTVEVDGKRGKIVGMNSSANLDVVFDDREKYGTHAHNCHPEWETRYFNDKGDCIADYREGVQHGGPHSV